MFTGISECMGQVISIEKNNHIMTVSIESPLSSEFKIDQSVCHDGICLTVVKTENQIHTVDLIPETLIKTNAHSWKAGTWLNIERSLEANGRFDGHIVQGHVDGTATVFDVSNSNDGYVLTFSHAKDAGMTVEKGSICINGISLTVFNSKEDSFSVALIPYTLEHTNLKFLKKGDTVNLEFDILGKYLLKYLSVALPDMGKQ
jgi:riboflavin synthase